MKIVIAGYGPVGEAIHGALSEHSSPSVRDSLFIDDPFKGHKYTPHFATSPPDAVIVCVATPANPDDGSCVTDNVDDIFKKYGRIKNIKFLIKSAVDPVWLSKIHSDNNFSITYSPEFLGGSNINRNPTEEFRNQTFAIFGGDDCRFWDELFRPVLRHLSEVKYCSLDQASFSKYVENCFLATKVTFFNEMHALFNACGFDGYDQMIDAITIDPRIGRSHTQVPGPDGNFGFGGHCLPKDVNALRAVAERLDRQVKILDSIVEINNGIRHE